MLDFAPGPIKKLLNKNKRGATQNCSDEISIVPSPDGKYAIVFSHGREITPMNWSYNITLLDKKLRIVEKFDRLTAASMSCAWTRDSSMFAFPVCVCGGLLLWNLRRAAFAAVRISSRQFIFEFQKSSHLLVQFDPEQLRAMNSEAVFGGGESEIPVERFKAPADCRVGISKVHWRLREELDDIGKIAREASVIDMDAIADGFFPFTGKFPVSTTDTFNGRPLEVFQLEAFADYGDKQAQVWLTAIKEKLGNSPDRLARARWTRVSKYLGAKKRNIPSGAK